MLPPSLSELQNLSCGEGANGGQGHGSRGGSRRDGDGGGRFGDGGRGLLLSLQPGIGLTGPNQSLIIFLTGCRSWSRLRRR